MKPVICKSQPAQSSKRQRSIYGDFGDFAVTKTAALSDTTNLWEKFYMDIKGDINKRCLAKLLGKKLLNRPT